MRLALLFMAALAFSGCFDVDEPLCSYACGDNGLCPDDYQCLPDGYCHLHGTPGSCGFSDASAPDSSVPDLGADLSSNDQAASMDLSMQPDSSGTD